MFITHQCKIYLYINKALDIPFGNYFRHVRHVFDFDCVLLHWFVPRTLENVDSISVLVLDVVVNGDDEHEDEEDASPAQEVPYVMPEKR